MAEERVQTASRKRFLQQARAAFDFLFCALTVALSLCNFFLSFTIVMSGSMEPTLRRPGSGRTILGADWVVVDRISYNFRRPRRGEIVAFRVANNAFLNPGLEYIKRLAGLPGDRIRCSSNAVFVNGRLFARSARGVPIRQAKLLLRLFPDPGVEHRVHQKCVFLVGDNLAESYDSRTWGDAPMSAIAGRVFWRLWPPGRGWGPLGGPPR